MEMQQRPLIESYFNFLKKFKRIEKKYKGFLSFSIPHNNMEMMTLFLRWEELKDEQVKEWIKTKEQENEHTDN